MRQNGATGKLRMARMRGLPVGQISAMGRTNVPGLKRMATPEDIAGFVVGWPHPS
jgi:hypothetical protein